MPRKRCSMSEIPAVFSPTVLCVTSMYREGGFPFTNFGTLQHGVQKIGFQLHDFTEPVDIHIGAVCRPQLHDSRTIVFDARPPLERRRTIIVSVSIVRIQIRD